MPFEQPRHTIRNIALSIVAFLAFVAATGGTWFMLKTFLAKHATDNAQLTSQKSAPPQPAAKLSGLQLDIAKSYGNKYASGLLPVGDSKYSTQEPKKGVVYTCSQYAQNLTTDKGGADSRGPWFVGNNAQYDINKKVHVQGNVSWKGAFTNTLSANKRTIVTNALPLAHGTGIYPVAGTDPAYSYDRNPNTIAAQNLTYTLNGTPSYGAPQCMGGEAGVMLTGVPLFNAFDAGGRDAGAWEVQDDCSGHPQSSGEYHYHTLSSCIKDISVHTVVGFALDGFPITGPQVATGSILTTDDLDECHGIISQITLDGKTVTTYHYVMTQDFPYSVSCFRSMASQPPGQPSGASATNGTSASGQNQQPSMQQGSSGQAQSQATQPPQQPTTQLPPMPPKPQQ